VLRLDGCCFEQKVGYGRDAAPKPQRAPNGPVFVVEAESDRSKTALKHAQNERFPLGNRNFPSCRLYKEGVGVPSSNQRKWKEPAKNGLCRSARRSKVVETIHTKRQSRLSCPGSLSLPLSPPHSDSGR